MDHAVEKALNDQLDNFVELFRVHSSFHWLLPLWLTTYSTQNVFSIAQSTGSYVFPPGGNLSAAFVQLYVLTFTKEIQVYFVMRAILLSMAEPSSAKYLTQTTVGCVYVVPYVCYDDPKRARAPTKKTTALLRTHERGRGVRQLRRRPRCHHVRSTTATTTVYAHRQVRTH